MPGGSVSPPACSSTARRRPASGTTGRRRSDSLTTARRYVVALGAGLGEHVRVADEQVERPGQAGRGRLVAGDEQGHQLVADLDVGHLRAVLEAGLDEQRADVGAGLPASLGDLGEQQVVDVAGHRLELLERLHAAEEHLHLQAGRGGLAEQVAEQPVQARAALGIGDAEDGLQDHVERDRLHARMDRERLAGRPRAELALGDLAHGRLVLAHPVTAERRQHHLAALDVLVALEQQQRPRAHQRLQRDLPARWHVVPALAVEGADRVRMRDDHQRRLEALEHDAERVAVGAPAVLEEADRPRQPARGLHGGGLRRSGG